AVYAPGQRRSKPPSHRQAAVPRGGDRRGRRGPHRAGQRRGDPDPAAQEGSAVAGSIGRALNRCPAPLAGAGRPRCHGATGGTRPLAGPRRPLVVDRTGCSGVRGAGRMGV
ncbi:MAG: hypothetical protein AVDCRST_MAG61-371, partial [uncultured Friedmanniella sp.]